jgi:cysteinyl-tRNA synthetase
VEGGDAYMLAGKSAALRIHQPQYVPVRAPERRLPEPQRVAARAEWPPSRPAYGQRVPSRHAIEPRQIEPRQIEPRQFDPRQVRAAGRRQTSTLRWSLVFVLKLVASALAGATITLVLWDDTPKPAKLDALLAEAAGRQETAVYRSGPPGDERLDRLVRSWDADSTDRPVPKNFPREIKTVKFVAPAPLQQLVTASLAPIARTPPSDVALPMGKGPSAVKSWRYQLQNIDPSAIAASSADLVVIDYAGADGPFTRAEVEQMRRKPDGSRRVLLSYMSIGEAESYRWYWPNRSSAWLGTENPKWRGNYSVRFWHPDWQQIIFDYTDKIIAAGFDGVYLDKVDEYEEMGQKDEMVAFVTRIAARAKSQRGDFMIVSQNGDALIPDAKFRKAIDAFAREDLFYGENAEGARNSAASIRESVRRLKMLTAEGKPVFVVEYPRNDEQAKTARREISDNKFIGLMAKRALDQL